MKVQSIFIFAIVIALNAPTAFAQTTTDLASETRDYVDSLINQMDETPASRFQVSPDYAIAGPKLQEEMRKKLVEFKATMQALIQGPLGESVRQFHENVRSLNYDQNRSRQLEATIQSQIKPTLEIYTAAVNHLYRLHEKWFNKVGWLNSSNSDYYDTLTNGTRPYSHLIYRTIKRQCKTRICFLSMYADYAAYYSSIENIVGTSWDITLNFKHGSAAWKISATKDEETKYVTSRLLNFKTSDYIDKFRK